MNGTLLGEVQDATLSHGGFALANFDDPPVLVTALAFLPLSAPSTATKETPFANTLGQRVRARAGNAGALLPLGNARAGLRGVRAGQDGECELEERGPERLPVSREPLETGLHGRLG